MSQHRRLVLKKASAALHGRPVILLRVTNGGRLVTEGASSAIAAPDPIERDVVRTLREWGLDLSDGDLWIVARGDLARWLVARVRGDLPRPAPAGVENRGADRLTLELAGLVLGGFEQSAALDQAAVYLSSAASALEECLGHVRDAAGLSTAVRARLLADLASVATAIEVALRAA